MQAAGAWCGRQYRRFIPPPVPAALRIGAAGADDPPARGGGRWAYRGFLAAAVAGLGWGLARFALLLFRVDLVGWGEILAAAGWSFLRVLAAVALGTAWTVPVGVWIGFNPRLAHRLQPLIQFAASFPAPMVYPWILLLVLRVGGSLEWGAVPLILLGTQWYILFNVAAAAAAVPADILSAAALLRLGGWARWRKFILPSVFPGLVTGWITAAGGAWNATIVSEFVHAGGQVYQATGLGALISRATDVGNFPRLAAAVLVMALVVAGINRFVWRPLQAFANDRCRFGN
jgi:NitT/TauT family transport system permease protein